MATQSNQAPYSYKDAGFSAFLRRSIDSPAQPATTLQQYARSAQQMTRSINFDNSPVSGQLAGITKVGENIVLDGNIGRISVLNEGDQVVALGNVDNL